MSEYRVDAVPAPRVKRTPEGYLRGEAVVTRTGVFTYVNADGTIRRELRHPDDILQAVSLDSLKMVPITVGHPEKMVNASNADGLQVGMTGETVRVDNGWRIVTSLTITGKSGIEAVERGDSQLSLGYNLDLVPESGNYDGEAYTHRQKNVVYNHLALVTNARAGKVASLNLDGASVEIQEDAMSTPNLVRVEVGGLHYDAAPEVEKALTAAGFAVQTATARADAAEKQVAKIETERDDAAKRADAAEKALAEALDPKRLDGLVAERSKLFATATKVAGKEINCDGMSIRQVHEAALAARYDGKIDLAGKSDDYVAARFDAASEAAPIALAPAPSPYRGFSPTFNGDSARADASAEAAALAKANEDVNAWRTKV